MKFYDKKNKRLVLFERKASPEFWDKHWDTDNFTETVKGGGNNKFIKKYTTKFLKSGARVLEGGCGNGHKVYGLEKWGYDAYGVDFAPRIVEVTNKAFPQLKISVQNVEKLDFSDDFFDGYWSLGVIEHFYDGYQQVIGEMERVIKPGGYLFLIFPYMSPLRKLKAKLGFYKSFENNLDIDNFYQFILDLEKVKIDVERLGFKLVLSKPRNVTKGIKDEILRKPFLRKIYSSRNLIVRGIRLVNSILFSKIAGHTILLVFQKK